MIASYETLVFDIAFPTDQLFFFFFFFCRFDTIGIHAGLRKGSGRGCLAVVLSALSHLFDICMGCRVNLDDHVPSVLGQCTISLLFTTTMRKPKKDHLVITARPCLRISHAAEKRDFNSSCSPRRSTPPRSIPNPSSIPLSDGRGLQSFAYHSAANKPCLRLVSRDCELSAFEPRNPLHPRLRMVFSSLDGGINPARSMESMLRAQEKSGGGEESQLFKLICVR